MMRLLAKSSSRREKQDVSTMGSAATKALFATTAAAAMSPLHFLYSYSSAQAFVVGGGGGGGLVPQRLLCSSSNAWTSKKSNSNGILPISSTGTKTTPGTSSTRLFSSFRKRDDNDNKNNDEGSFLSKLGNMAKNTAKAILPSTWFQSEKEQKAAIERKRVQNQLSRDVNDVLKNAPLPVRMLGNIVAPLLGNVMSGMAESIAEQQQAVDALLQNARTLIENDDLVAGMLGGSIQVDPPFSQSSRSMSINGQTQTRVELAFMVSGSRGLSCVARLTAANNEIQQLLVQTSPDGRSLSVNIKGGGGGGGGRRRQVQGGGGKMSSSSSNDNIIEAEIIEKDTKR
jgi:hypothetical protein